VVAWRMYLGSSACHAEEQTAAAEDQQQPPTPELPGFPEYGLDEARSCHLGSARNQRDQQTIPDYTRRPDYAVTSSATRVSHTSRTAVRSSLLRGVQSPSTSERSGTRERTTSVSSVASNT